MQSLVEKSLVRFTDGRYWMLETIREYAGDRLEDADRAPHVARLHADHYLELSERARERALGGDPEVRLRRIRTRARQRPRSARDVCS